MAQRILKTRDYSKFSFLRTNRDVDQGHINTLTKVFEEYGNLTKILPILVNEKMKVIDGQHRLEVCETRGDLVNYIVVPGLTARDARQMNITHKGWNVDDYAKSYAEGGNENYITYRQLKEEYEVPHKVLISAVYSSKSNDTSFIYKRFREGDMVITDLDKVRELLEVVSSVKEMTGIGNGAFYLALLKATKAEGYDHKHMLRKLAQFGERLYKPYAMIEDNLRLIEEIYNYAQAENHRTMLY